MLKKNKKNEKKNRIKLFILGIVIVFVLFQGILNYGMLVVNYFMFPIQKGIYYVGNYVKETSTAILKYRENLKENMNLKIENAKYELVVMENKKLMVENERLKKILNIKNEKKLNVKVATVNFRNHNNLYNMFFINVGKRDGIEKDMVVLSGEVLIGKIGKVFDDYSVVDMITAENFNVSGVTEGNMLGIVKGDGDGDGTLYFEPSTFQDTVSVGEKVYTSGISEIYPKGLYIGKISEIDDNDVEIFRNIRIKNDVDILNLTEVLILVPQS